MAILSLMDAFGGGGQGATAPSGAPSTPSAPGGGGIVPLTQAFQPGEPSLPLPPSVSAQPRPSQPRSIAQGQPQQPGGPDTLGQIGAANTLLQQAGKVGDWISPGLTKDIGGTGLNLSDIGGPISLARGITSGNVPTSVGGALSTAGTLGRLGAQYFDMPVLGQAGNVISSLGGPLSLAMGIKNKDPLSIASGALSTYGAASNLIQTLGGTALPSLGTAAATALAEFAPGLAAGIANAFGGAAVTASSGTAAIAPALSAAAAGIGAVAAPIIMAITSYISASEEKAAREAGWWNNPIKGALSSASTAGVAQANRNLDQISQAGVENVPTEVLTKSLPNIINSLMPYYATAQGGEGAIRASDTFTGGHGGGKSKPSGDVGQYTQNFFNARDRVAGVVQSLLDRGVSYEDLGKLPVSGNWVMQSLDAGGTPEEFYERGKGKYDVEGQQLLSKSYQAGGPMVPEMVWESTGEGGHYVETGRMIQQGGIAQEFDPAQFSLGVSDMLRAAEGSAALSTDENTHASGLITAMYGGPLWAALARMGVGGKLGELIQSKFDPWVVIRGFNQEQLYGALSGHVLPGMRMRQWEMQSANVGGAGSDGGAPGDGGGDGGDGGGGDAY